MCSMVNVSKSLLNVVSGNQAKVADKPEPKRCAVGCSPVSWEHMDKQDCRRIGGTKPTRLITRNVVSPRSLRTFGKLTARKADRNAGKERWKKRMPAL